MGVLSAVAVAVGLTWGFPEWGYRLGSAATIGIGVGIAMGGLVIGLRLALLRRGVVPVVPGGDAATRRAVRRALRDGHADDGRIDSLTREFIDRSPRVPWLPYLYLAVVAVSVLRLIVGSHETRDLVLQSALAVTWLLCAVGTRLQQRRLATYGSR